MDEFDRDEAVNGILNILDGAVKDAATKLGILSTAIGKLMREQIDMGGHPHAIDLPYMQNMVRHNIEREIAEPTDEEEAEAAFNEAMSKPERD